MQLQDRSGADRRHRPLDQIMDRLRFLRPRGYEHRVAGVQDGAQPLGHYVMGHFAQAAEEAGIIPARLLNEGFDARSGGQ